MFKFILYTISSIYLFIGIVLLGDALHNFQSLLSVYNSLLLIIIGLVFFNLERIKYGKLTILYPISLIISASLYTLDVFTKEASTLELLYSNLLAIIFII